MSTGETPSVPTLNRISFSLGVPELLASILLTVATFGILFVYKVSPPPVIAPSVPSLGAPPLGNPFAQPNLTPVIVGCPHCGRSLSVSPRIFERRTGETGDLPKVKSVETRTKVAS